MKRPLDAEIPEMITATLKRGKTYRWIGPDGRATVFVRNQPQQVTSTLAEHLSKAVVPLEREISRNLYEVHQIRQFAFQPDPFPPLDIKPVISDRRPWDQRRDDEAAVEIED